MKIRRQYFSNGRIEVQALGEPAGSWETVDHSTAFGYDSPFTQAWEVSHARLHGARDGDLVLPFQPMTLRDFSLTEEHNVDAARGYARRFMPAAAKLAGVVEATTRRTFPLFRPNPLWYRQPLYYMHNPLTFVPSGTSVSFPSYSTALDYELQLGFVLNRPLHDVTPESAEQAIGAFVVICDFSARDVQIPEMKSGFGPQKAKHFLSSMSTVAVTADQILPSWRKLRGSVTINGEVVARPHIETARFELGDLLAHASASEQLEPGEFFSTGTFVGGSGMEISRWLAPGDTLRLEIDGVGHVEHTIDGGR